MTERKGQVFTREELYELVWDRAVSNVAPELGISDVALRKQCIKHRIPLPDARYWGKRYAGKPVERVPLPPAPEDLDRISIRPAATRARPPEMEDAIQAAQAAQKPTRIANTLHPLVAATMKVARKTGANYDGVISFLGSECFHIRAHPDTLERVGTFLNSLVRQALARGYRFEAGKNGFDAVVEAERIPFRVNQTIRRTRHEPTEDELSRQRRWDARHYGQWDRWTDRPTIPMYDFTPTGEMSVEFDLWIESCPRRIADTRATKLENRIDQILDVMAAYAAGLKLRRREQEEARQRAERERIRRAEEARLAELERQRISYIETKAEQLRQLHGLQRLLEHLRAQPATAELNTTLTWLEDPELLSRHPSVSCYRCRRNQRHPRFPGASLSSAGNSTEPRRVASEFLHRCIG